MKPFTYEEYRYYKKILYPKSIFKLCDTKENYLTKKKKINQPHDKMFKEILEDKEETVKFINEILKLEGTDNELKKDDIEKYNREFITDEFSNIEADIIYKKKEQNIFFLIEHQSTIDYSMPYRILRYNMAIMESAINKRKIRNKEYKLPTIFSFVIYTGDKKWNAQSYLIEKQEKLNGYNQQEFANFEVIDINNYTEEELLHSDRLLPKLMLLEKSNEVEDLGNYIDNIIKTNPNNNQKIFLKKVINYIFNDKINSEKLEEYNIKLGLERGEDSMTLKEKAEKWIDQMIEERGKDIIEKEEVIAQKEEVVAQKEEAVAQKEEEIIKREGKIEQREKYIKMREENINKTKDNFIIGMIKSRIDESTILEITRIDKKELDKIKEKYNLAVVN